MPEVPEYVVNVKLAEILSKDFGIDARAERIKRRKRPDIRCFYRGLIIGIEASYNKSDAEKDAMARIEQGLVDMALALWIKTPYKDVPETMLEEYIRKSKFDVKVFVPKEIMGTLIPFLEKRIEKKAEPATGWFEDIDLPTLKIILDHAMEFLVKEEEIEKLIGEIKQKISDFTKSLALYDTQGEIRRKIYDLLYKLYGLSVAEASDPEVAFGHAALSILLSAVFYEHVRSIHPQLEALRDYVRNYGPIDGLRKALEDLLNIDYRTAIEITTEVLRTIPPNFAYRVRDLVDLAIKISQNRSLLAKDFAGRVYHEITGDIALKKGFATFYTEVPAAYLLAILATETLLGLDKKSMLYLDKEEAQNMIEKLRNLKVGDMACGSGTLLTAIYYSLYRIASALKYYHDLENVKLDEIGKMIIENNIYGIDALRYASQITAINLALIGPSIITKENVYTIYLGYIPEKNQAWLGSLELLNNAKRVEGLLAWIEGGLKGVAERVSLEGVEGVFEIPSKFNVIIMNPPFTRPTYRGRVFPEESRAFFGFITSEKLREKLRERYKGVLEKITEDLRNIARTSLATLTGIPYLLRQVISGKGDEKLRQYLNIGLAGEALPFLYLAYKYVDDDGVIAFVLPRAVLAGVSWFLARVLLASKFHVRYVVVSSDPKNGYNFSEGAALSETLIVARRVTKHNPQEETTFIILTRKPRTLLEGILLAEEIKKAEKTGEMYVSLGANGAQCIVHKVSKITLLKYIDNWNRFVAVPDPILGNYILKLLEQGEIVLGDIYVKVPITRLGYILKTITIKRRRGRKTITVPTKSIGIDAHQFYELYTKVPKSPYPAFIGTEEKFRQSMRIKPNAYIAPKNEKVKEKATEIFDAYSGRILVPGVNVRWNTSRVIVTYSDQELLSNTHYAIKLDVQEHLREYAEKSLVLWFNTTWGLLSILINREETEGAWAQIKMGQWMLMPVLDVVSLDLDTLKRLAKVFDRYADKTLRRIPQQFNPVSPDPVRFNIDVEFLKALSPGIDENIVKEELRKLYKRIHVAIQLWTGS
mgnify:CR=1 FL=1